MPTRSLLILIPTLVFHTLVCGQVPVLLKDINPVGGSSPISFTCYNGVHYFTAIDEHGRELWRTDGTEAGTFLVKDIVPGSANSILSYPMVMGDHLYFIRGEGLSRFLWRTDGTEAGTQEVLRIDDLESLGLTGWDYFEAFGDRIFFGGVTPELGRELWSTDGTVEGTQLFRDFRPGPSGSGLLGLKTYMNRLYFTASIDSGGEKHWITDGTQEGTYYVTDLPSNGGFDPPDFFGVGDLVYFTFDLVNQGGELHVTDGTPEGTGLVRDLRPGPNSSSPQDFAILNDQLHFCAYSTSTLGVKRIHQTDGTSEGTIAWPELGIDRPDYGLIAHNGYLHFTAYTGTVRELWRSDGTIEGTQQIPHPQDDEALNSFQSGTSMCSCNGTFYFAASYTEATGREFYLLDAPTPIATEDGSAQRNVPYPNPVSSSLMVQAEGPFLARLLDSLGREVRTWRLSTGTNTVHLDGLSEGIYSLMTSTGTYRIMKQ